MTKLEVGPAEVPDADRRPCGDRMLCEEGLRTLDPLLPDGRVTRCRYMPEEAELVVGDLRFADPRDHDADLADHDRPILVIAMDRSG